MGCILDTTSGELVIKPCPGKYKAIRDMPLTSSKHDALVLLGMVMQLLAWFPQLAFNIQIMRVMTWKNIKFVNTADLEREFMGSKGKEYLLYSIPLSQVDPMHLLKNPIY